MTDSDPFADANFTTRLQKLLPMLASEQPGEAEAARRKLIEHLAHFRLGLTDLAGRLGAPTHSPSVQSFSTGARELTLQRQLGVARTALQEAQADAAKARAQLSDIMMAWQQATLDANRALKLRDRFRLATFAAASLAAICLVVLLMPFANTERWDAAVPANALSLQVSGPAAAAASLVPGPGERAGTTLVQDMAVRLTPSNDADVRAFLNLGTRVVIEREAHVGVQTWLEVRSVSGTGWVRAGDVLH